MSEVVTGNDFDLIIIGGGLAGASLACALRNISKPGLSKDDTSSFKIALVEAHALNTELQPSYDDRSVAISYGSRTILEGIGLWSSLSAHVESIDTIHISDRGHFGVTRLTKEQENVEALGYVLENKRLGQQLYEIIDDASAITLFCPAELTLLERMENQVTVELTVDGKKQQLNGKLLVAADGNNSQVMQLLNIGSSQKSYQQTALITNVTPGKKHDNVAYERFTDSGPLAFLPMRNNRCSVVWTLLPEQAKYLLALDDEDFLVQLQERFGYRLGQLRKVGTRHGYPLSLQAATQTVQARIAIIGNAAHSVHPVAGQGFNLALRDISLLSELITEAHQSGGDIGQLAMLQHYEQSREHDIKRVYRFTDALVKTFSNAIVPLAHLRSLSLLLVDILPDVKHQLANQSMGLSGRLTRLARGLRL